MGGTHAHELIAPDASGFLARRDPRARVLSAVVLVLAIVLVPKGDRDRLLALGFAALGLAALAGPPLPLVFLRGCVVLPFATLAAIFLPFTTPGTTLVEALGVKVTREGLAAWAELVARSLACGVALAAVAASSDEASFVRGLSGLGVPRLIVLTMAFTLRYLGTLADEGRRMRLGRELREFRPPSTLRALAALGRHAGTLFVRTFERAERIHAAMVARGFRGEVPTLAPRRLGGRDVALVLACLAAAAVVHGGPRLARQVLR